MSRKTIEIVTCDMCGAEIDTHDDITLRMSVVGGDYYTVPVHEHNPSYDEELQDGVHYAKLDLCPKCADRVQRLKAATYPNICYSIQYG